MLLSSTTHKKLLFNSSQSFLDELLWLLLAAVRREDILLAINDDVTKDGEVDVTTVRVTFNWCFFVIHSFAILEFLLE